MEPHRVEGHRVVHVTDGHFGLCERTRLYAVVTTHVASRLTRRVRVLVFAVRRERNPNRVMHGVMSNSGLSDVHAFVPLFIDV